MRLMTLSLVFASLLSGQSVFQGTVTDTDGETLPGVQVFLKDTYVGTTTSMEGEFKIALPENSGVLVFSYIGYETQEVEVSSDTPTPFSVEMTVDVLKGDEVLVTGLASSVKRRNAANAVASVSGEELVGAPVQTLDAALNGKFAGVRVRHNSGAPGGGMSVNLRGVSTITGETQPLYVIDGVIVNNNTNQSGIDVVSAATGAGSARPQGQPANRISDFNPNDIESMVILKDASATAIYGSRAANGVIIITTKSSKSGEFKYQFSSATTTYSAVDKVDVLSADSFRDLVNSTGDGDAIGRLGEESTDWQDEIYDTAIGLDYSMSASGQFNGMPLRLSLGVSDHDGILSGDNIERKTASFNFRPESGKLKMSFNSLISITDNVFANRGAIGNAISFDPTQGVFFPYDQNNAPPYGGYNSWIDPVTGSQYNLAPTNPVALHPINTQ